jgi:hypothetical protein
MSSSSGSIYTQSLQDTESRMTATIANNGVRYWGLTIDRLQAAALGQSSGIGVSDSGWWFGEGEVRASTTGVGRRTAVTGRQWLQR